MGYNAGDSSPYNEVDVLESKCYLVLGVKKQASQDAVKRAFRIQILQNHPDHNPNDPEAAERARSLIEAYQMLSKPERKPQKREVRATYEVTYPPMQGSLPVHLRQCVAIVVFIAILLGVFSLVQFVTENRQPVFKPITNVIIPADPEPSYIGMSSARENQERAIGYSAAFR